VNTFSSSRLAEAVVDGPIESVWELLVDPSVLARHTPFISTIRDLGDDKWCWSLSGITYPGGHFGATFIEEMTFMPTTRIDFRPDPDAGNQRAGATGTYTLTEDGPRTHLRIELTVSIQLPAPKAARRLIEPAMHSVIAYMGDSFAKGFVRELSSRT